jgi:hypothetical protein
VSDTRVVRLITAGLILLAGCGRISFDTIERGDALGPGDGPAGDVPLATGPFSTPTPIAALANPAMDEEPTFTADLLELYFCSDRLGGRDIFVSTRATAADPWGAPAIVAEISPSNTQEFSPGLAPDGLTIWFASNRTGGLGFTDIYVSTRATRATPWSPPQLVTELSSSDEDFAPAVNSSGLTMVISSRRSGNMDMFISTRASSSDPWSTPVAITELNLAMEDGAGRLLRGDLELWFHSARPGGTGGTDLWVATRPSITDPFGAPVELAELNSTSADWDLWVSADTRYLVFGTYRLGHYEIHEAAR